jgi:hypothetical protein
MEHLSHPRPFTRAHWLNNVRRSLLVAFAIIACSLLLGVLGYRFIGGLSWIDALLEASMILGGMGAIAPMHGDAVKLFASFYALFSGFVVLSTTGLLLAPWVHRLVYHSHRQARRDSNAENTAKPTTGT